MAPPKVIASIELSRALGLKVGVPVTPAQIERQVKAHTRRVNLASHAPTDAELDAELYRWAQKELGASDGDWMDSIFDSAWVNNRDTAAEQGRTVDAMECYPTPSEVMMVLDGSLRGLSGEAKDRAFKLMRANLAQRHGTLSKEWTAKAKAAAQRPKPRRG
jgi:hypothetical protein